MKVFSALATGGDLERFGRRHSRCSPLVDLWPGKIKKLRFVIFSCMDYTKLSWRYIFFSSPLSRNRSWAGRLLSDLCRLLKGDSFRWSRHQRFSTSPFLCHLRSESSKV